MINPDPDILVRMEHLSIADIVSKKKLVHDISFQLKKGECLGLVGESGSGKTMCCRALMGLLPLGLKVEGQAWFEDVDMLHADDKKAREMRGTGISSILQQPMTVFDPLYTIGAQIVETLCNKLFLSKKEAQAQAREILGKINLGAETFGKYPHQLSGGMLQRCMIALSLALGSKVVVADEPTTALDAENQYEVLRRLERMRKKYRTTLIFVSHDLGAVQMLADTVLVMHNGHCVEYGNAETIFNSPQNPYTMHLVETRLALTRAFKRLVGGLDGTS